MKILKLQAENVKRLKAIEITPDGNIVKITGKNRAGKSSTLDAIWLALGGDKAVKGTKTTEVIRDGESKAVSKLDLGDYIVTRTWINKGDSTLKVESREGKKFASPQAMLDKLVGKLSFDPLGFMDMDGRGQKETLLRMIGLDPAEFDKQRTKLFEERTIMNRQVKDLKATLGAFDPHENEGDLPEKEENAADLLKEYQTASATIAANNRKRMELNQMRDHANTIIGEVEALEQQLANKRTQLAAIRVNGQALSAEVEALVDPDLEALGERLQNIEDVNRKVRERNRHVDLWREMTGKQEVSEALTKEITSLDQAKADAIRKANLPVQGLDFTEDGVTYNSLPLSQASHAEQIYVSMAMGMALNPELRVLLIKDGEKFDSDTWALVEKLASENDYQIWAEMVDETGTVGVYIEDGEVKQYEQA